MEAMETDVAFRFGNMSLSGGELTLAVIKLFIGTFGSRPDLAMVNLLLFLIEGDGELQSDILFSNTPYGPKSAYLHNFIKENPELVKARSYGRRTAGSRVDPDVRRKLDLTDTGSKLANIAIGSLSQKEKKTITTIISGWGAEKHTEILTYICVFFHDFCTSVERKADD